MNTPEKALSAFADDGESAHGDNSTIFCSAYHTCAYFLDLHVVDEMSLQLEQDDKLFHHLGRRRRIKIQHHFLFLSCGAFTIRRQCLSIFGRSFLGRQRAHSCWKAYYFDDAASGRADIASFAFHHDGERARRHHSSPPAMRCSVLAYLHAGQPARVKSLDI